jgi:aspartyl-tRNA(Asn)/glutamyl-tRNA(Gln) amidotransferase subunit A
MTDIHDLSAVELLKRYRAKTLSRLRSLRRCREHIARWEPHIKALYAYDPEARARSRRVHAALGEGRRPARSTACR